MVKEIKETGTQAQIHKTSRLMVYNYLGIRLLNRIIMATIGKAVLHVNPKEKMPSYYIGHPFDRDSLALTMKWLWFNEFTHAFLVVVCGAIGYFFYQRGYISGVIIIVLTILINLALMVMQRMNRQRIRRMMKILKNRDKND